MLWPEPEATTAPGVFEPRELPRGSTNLPVVDGALIYLPRRLESHVGPGHVGIYFDENRQTEVDIFEIYAQPDGTRFGDYVEVVQYVERSSQFAGLIRSNSSV